MLRYLVEQNYSVEWNEEFKKPGVLEFLHPTNDQHRRFTSVNSLKGLANYLHVIQGRVYGYECHNIATFLIRDYVSEFAKTVKSADYSLSRPEKIQEMAKGLYWIDQPKMTDNQRKAIQNRLWDYDDIVSILSKYAQRIAKNNAVNAQFMDYMLREHIGILEDFELRCSQHQLNRLKNALWPLYDHCRFESQYTWNITR